MNLDTATAPLKTGEGRLRFSCGPLYRGYVRKLCSFNGLNYYEEKGILSSVFIVIGPDYKIIALNEKLKEYSN